MKSMTKLIAVISLATVLSAPAADIIWTNTAGGAWATAANWSPNKVPGSTDTAYLTNAGTYGVNVSANVTVTNLVVGGASGTLTLTNTSGTLNAVTGATIGPNGRFVLAGGTLAGSNTMTLAGTMLWTGGGFSSAASVTVLASGTLSVSGSAAKSFTGAITNAGTMLYAPTGAGCMNFAGGVLHTQPGGVCEVPVDNQFNDAGGANLIVNEGTLRRTTSAGTFTNEIPFVNRGLVDVQSGTIRMTDGGTLGTGTVFSGDGQKVLAAGTFTLAGTVVATNMQWSGGAIAGTGSLSGSATWSQGSLSGELLVATDGVLTISGSGTKSITAGSLTNAGTVVVATTGAGYVRFTSATMHTLAGGVCEVQTDNQFNAAGGANLLVNEGTLRRTTSANTFTNEIPFLSRGVVDAQIGTLLMTGGGTLATGSLFGGAGQTVLASGTFTLAGAVVASNLILSGTSFAGTGSLSGTATWNQGSLAGDLLVATDGTLTITGPGTKSISSGSLTNAGKIVYAPTGAGYVSFTFATMHTLAGGVCEVQTDNQFNAAGGVNLLVNDGTLRRTTSTGVFTNRLPFLSRGVVDVPAGTIRMTGGGTLATGSLFSGAGQAVLAAGTFNLDGTITTANLVLDGATLGGAGGFDGSLTWIGGSISSAVDLNIPPGGQLLLLGSDAKTVYGSITNAGTITYASSNSVTLVKTLHNQPGGVFEIWNDQPINSGSSASQIVNEGTARKLAGTGTTTNKTRWFNRGGTVNVQSGTLRLLAGGTLETGSAFTGGGQTVLAAGSFDLLGTISSENLVLDGATLGGAGGFNGSLTWIGGAIDASVDLNIPAGGRLVLLGSSAKTVHGSITNAGTITYASSNYFTLAKTLHNLPGGLFEIWNDQQINYGSGNARIVNEGTLRKAAGLGTTTNEIPTLNTGTVEALSGTLRFQGAYTQTLAGNVGFRLGGTSAAGFGRMSFATKPAFSGSVAVQLASSYLPAAGDRFPILSFPSHTGGFQCWDGLYLLGHNLRLTPEWTSTNLTLVTVSLPDPTEPPLRVAADSPTAVVCWPAEFTGYSLWANTNLSITNWSVLPGVTNRHVETPMMPEKFFRLGKP